MVVYCVDIYVNEVNIGDFIEATGANHLATRRERGNLRFDLIRDQEDPSHFILYEVYKSDESVVFHKEQSHYLIWRERVAPFMAKPRCGKSYSPLYPGDESQW